MKRRIIVITVILAFAGICSVSWTLVSRAAYESAAYEVVESDGEFEIRRYPDLILATTATKLDSQGRDGSFMRLFQFISGENESKQKISMTTPVFMEEESEKMAGSMGFVMPQSVADQGVPKPLSQGVKLRQRKGGRFAVVRFSGKLDRTRSDEYELNLREWMQSRGLVGEEIAEAAGYDPPFTPGPLRRNEVLIRIKALSQDAEPTT